MYALKRILVGLDLTKFDDDLISYTSFFADVTKPDHVYFIHVSSNLDVPSGILEEHPGLVIPPLDESIEKALKIKIDTLFKHKGCTTSVEVHEGNPTDKILRWSNIKEVDLIVMGRKDQPDSDGILPGKIANMCHCSMLLITPEANLKLDILSVPLDFSDFSKLAMEKAMEIKSITGAKIIAKNIYRVPAGYHYSGKSFDEFAEIMKLNSKKDFLAFLSRLDINPAEVELELALEEDEYPPALKLYEMSVSCNADLMLIGSKGRTALASLVLGSVVEKMIKVDNTVPLLIVKNKEENLSFFDALMKL